MDQTHDGSRIKAREMNAFRDGPKTDEKAESEEELKRLQDAWLAPKQERA